MKDAEVQKQFTAMEDSERFQALFSAQQTEIEQQIEASSLVKPADLQQHFAQISSALQSLQELYSSSAPYIRIYDRKIAQDKLHALQTKLQEVEAKFIPRKKFGFKGKKEFKGKEVDLTSVKNGSETKKPGLDFIDGPGTSVLQNREGETIVLQSDAVTGKDLLLSNLRNCNVQVFGAPSTMHIASVDNCTISCGPVTTSVFVEGAHCCHFQLSCQQLRIHDTIDTEFRIHVTCKAIIEDSRALRFGIYSFNYPSIEKDFKVAGLRKDVNHWSDIDDFNWLVVGQQSPNWSLIDSSDS